MLMAEVYTNKVGFKHAPWRHIIDFCRETGAYGAINFGFFFRGSNPPGTSRPLGTIIVDGKVVYGSWWHPEEIWHAVVRFKNGTLKIIHSPGTWVGHEDFFKTIDWMVSAGPIVLRAREVGILQEPVFPGLAGMRPTTQVPRVGIGLNSDQSRAIFVRHPAATILEMGYIFKGLGCRDAILGDGGSSASFKSGPIVEGTALVPNALYWEEEIVTTKPLIYIDAGHGGTDSGAVGHGMQEKTITLDLALRLQSALEYFECSTRMARTGDYALQSHVMLDRQARVNEANSINADLYFSIHVNGHTHPDANGYEDFIHPLAGTATRDIQRAAHSRIAQPWVDANRHNRGMKEANFQVLRTTRMSALLVEQGFITNATDASLLRSSAFRDQLVSGMVDGLVRALDLKLKEEDIPGGGWEQELLNLKQRLGNLETRVTRLER